jgi:urease subunit gamma/beta
MPEVPPRAPLTEQERLLLPCAAELARRSRARGLKLNLLEAMALVTDHVLEGARDGVRIAGRMQSGRTVLTEDDVMDGVPELLEKVQVDATFPDGTELAAVHHPIPGQVVPAGGFIETCPGAPRIELEVTNTGERPVQVGSHFHVARTNQARRFDRGRAYGRRLDITALPLPGGRATTAWGAELHRVVLADGALSPGAGGRVTA